MAANTWMIPCFTKNDLQWCVEFSVNGFCCYLIFWSVFFFAPSAVLAFAVEASEPILATYRWIKMVANAMRISCFAKNNLQWLTGVCCCLGFWTAFFFAPFAVLAFAVEASQPILAMGHWTKMFANYVMRISCFVTNILQFLTGVCSCLGFWSVFFFAPSAILAFAVEASQPILAMDHWTKMVANAMRISCFMKNNLLWLTGVCCC